MKKQIQLFCIPYAGGSAEVFHGLQKLLPEEIELIPLEYAGHGNRRKEEFYSVFDDMTADVARQIREKRNLELPYGILGYSMGSIVAYELFTGEYAADEAMDLPVHVFLAAHEAPDAEWECRSYVNLDDEAFMEIMLSFGGFSRYEPGFLKNRFFRALYFRPMREDYRLLSQYQIKSRVQIPVPVTMFYAPQDVPEEKAQKWSGFAGAGIEYTELGTNHFFLRDRAQEMADRIAEKLLKERF